MEPDAIPLPSYSPPPLDGGSEEEEFGDFSTGGVCTTIVHAGQTEPTSFFRQTSPTEKPSTALPNPAEETHRPPSEESRNHDSESNLHTGEDRLSETFGSSIASSSLGETGFADFTFFTEQAGHPWCCGFTEEWDGKVEEQDCDSSREVITEPRSQHVPKANRGVRVERKHCDRNAAVQNHRQSQEDEANIQAPCHDGPSLEGDSADLEPNVLSLTSQNCQTDDETEVVEVCLINSSTAKTDTPHCNATQGTSATSCQQHSGTHSQDKCADSADVNMERHREPVETADTGVRSLGSLPPSDSFADFCSAPGWDDEEGPSWANFAEEMRTQLREPEEESEQDGETRMERCQASASSSLQRLLRSSFPEVFVPVVEAKEDLPNLGALLHVQRCAETEKGTPELRPSLRIQQLMLSPHEDIHASLSLQFKWGGSHSNTTLLRCLGVDPRNIVFIGAKKQTVAVPAYASSLGMLDPTKDSPPAVCSPRRVTLTAPSAPEDTQKSPIRSAQELPLKTPDWSSRGLSGSQEVCSSFDLDYFGSEEESRSSCSRRTSSPPPGVDRELYELIISKLETGNSQKEDALNRLMSAAGRTNVSARKPSAQEELSAEAGRMISELPDLTFMQAKVLMFPMSLAPSNHASPELF